MARHAAPDSAGRRARLAGAVTASRAALIAVALVGCSQLGCAGIASAQQEAACDEQPGRADESDVTASPTGDAGAKHPKLESRLAAAAGLATTAGGEASLRAARDSGLTVVGESIRVVVESAGPDLDAARAAVLAAGGTVEAEYADLIQALLPPSALVPVANDPAVRYVRAPAQAVPDRGR